MGKRVSVIWVKSLESLSSHYVILGSYLHVNVHVYVPACYQCMIFHACVLMWHVFICVYIYM